MAERENPPVLVLAYGPCNLAVQQPQGFFVITLLRESRARTHGVSVSDARIALCRSPSHEPKRAPELRSMDPVVVQVKSR